MVKKKNTPHGGKLVNLIVSKAESEKLKKASVDFKSLNLSPRQICDLEVLMNGGFSPLDGFMIKADYDKVCSDMRLADGTLWPMPVTLDVSEELAKSLKKKEKIVLRDQEGVVLAIMDVEDIWKPNKTKESEQVYGSADAAHPAIDHLLNNSGEYYIGGKITGLELPTYHDFSELRNTPAELRKKFEEMGWDKIVAFQTRNPMHRAHVELTMRAAEKTGAKLLIHPVSGMTKPGDVDHYTRVRVYKSILSKYPEASAMISLLPIAMRMGGPREALWHMIIRKNYGVTHFIVGRDHAGPGKNSQGEDFYGPYDAQEMAEKYAKEIGVEVVPFQMMVYVDEQDAYMPIDDVPKNVKFSSISGTELRDKLAKGDDLPEWFTYREVADELQKTYRPRHKRGLTVLFTGLSGSGKSTIANALMVKLLEHGERTVTLLDGDIVRQNLSSELGFSKEHRNLNVARIGYVASEISKHGGIAICAPIAPYDAVRKSVRNMVQETGGRFVLVHVSTDIETCEARDRKGLYAAARAGKIKEFTGISDPYEAPEDADITIDTVKYLPQESVKKIMDYLYLEGLLVE